MGQGRRWICSKYVVYIYKISKNKNIRKEILYKKRKKYVY